MLLGVRSAYALPSPDPTYGDTQGYVVVIVWKMSLGVRSFCSFRSNDDVSANGGAGGRIMEATQKSFEKSKETVEGSAKSAAAAVEQKVHDTADKVKDTISAGRKTDEKTEDTVPSGHDEL